MNKRCVKIFPDLLIVASAINTYTVTHVSVWFVGKLMFISLTFGQKPVLHDQHMSTDDWQKETSKPRVLLLHFQSLLLRSNFFFDLDLQFKVPEGTYSPVCAKHAPKERSHEQHTLLFSINC